MHTRIMLQPRSHIACFVKQRRGAGPFPDLTCRHTEMYSDIAFRFEPPDWRSMTCGPVCTQPGRVMDQQLYEYCVVLCQTVQRLLEDCMMLCQSQHTIWLPHGSTAQIGLYGAVSSTMYNLCSREPHQDQSGCACCMQRTPAAAHWPNVCSRTRLGAHKFTATASSSSSSSSSAHT